MPRKAKRFPKTTQASVDRAVGWAKSALYLQDYSIAVWLCDDPPEGCGDTTGTATGEAQTDVRFKRADIWISPRRIVNADEDPMETLMHEMVHVMFADAGIRRDGGETHVHGVVYRLGEILAKAYRAGVKL